MRCFASCWHEPDWPAGRALSPDRLFGGLAHHVHEEIVEHLGGTTAGLDQKALEAHGGDWGHGGVGQQVGQGPLQRGPLFRVSSSRSSAAALAASSALTVHGIANPQCGQYVARR